MCAEVASNLQWTAQCMQHHNQKCLCICITMLAQALQFRVVHALRSQLQASTAVTAMRSTIFTRVSYRAGRLAALGSSDHAYDVVPVPHDIEGAVTTSRSHECFQS